MAEKISSKKLTILRIITAVVILICGEGLRRYLASFKKPPAQSEMVERTYTVQALTAKRSNHLISLKGYGVIKSSEIVNISPEITGVISYVNPKLEKGLTIDKGETLFKIQEDDFKLAVIREQNRIQTINTQIKELQTDISYSQKALELLEKQLYLAKRDLNRQEKLLSKGIGSQVTKDNVERSYITVEASVLSSKQRIAASESKIDTLKNRIKEAEILMELNKNNLAKCIVKSPETLRVASENIEKGQLASPGITMIVLENDSKLEIPVMVSGPDVVKWLKLDGTKKNLFTSLSETNADIYWTEAKDNKKLASGKLSRIESYDSGNRMAKGLVEIDKLFDIAAPGMFCEVEIAGKELQQVFKVPRVALNQKIELLAIVNGRLKFEKCTPIFDEGDFIYVEAPELSEAILVINNKLTNPISGMKIKVEDE